jgi:hypothetical protein
MEGRKVHKQHEFGNIDSKEIKEQDRNLRYLSAIMSREWLEEAESVESIIKLYPKLRYLSCKTFSEDIVQGLLTHGTLTPSQRFRCQVGHVLQCK